MADSYKFNPGFMTDAQSIANFLVRKNELQRVLAAFEGTGAGEGERFLLLGARGAGKTTICRRVMAEVRTNLFMSERWEPIFLSEESYTVTTPGELLLECLFLLGQQPAWRHAKNQYEEAREVDDESALQATCLDFFRKQVKATGKRFLIIVENLHMIMRDQLSGDPLDLVAVISDEKLFGVLATAVDQTSDQNAEALPPGFTVMRLGPLTLDECYTLWRGLTGLDVDKTRIRPLQILTGGSPRLINILAEFMQTPSLSDLMGNLNRLIDQNTEYFKNQLDLLPSGERKVFVTLLEAWDPSSAKQVAQAGRVPINLASAALGRLAERGMVEKSPGPGRSILYHASERLFNIYYLMRRRTHPSDRVKALVAFMTQYYDQKELVDTTTKLALEACRVEPSQRSDFHSLFDAISHRLSDSARAEMMSRVPENFLQSLRRDEFLQRYSPTPKARAYRPGFRNDYEASLEAARSAVNAANYEVARAHVQKAASLKPKAIQPWILKSLVGLFSGNHEESIAAASTAVEMKSEDMAAHSILGTALAAAGRDKEAEVALEKAIELNPEALRALIELAKLRAKHGAPAEALDAFRRASELAPLGDEDVARFARRLLRHDPDEAEVILREAISRIEDPRAARRVLVELLHEQGRDTEASQILKQSALAGDDWERWAEYISFLIDVEDEPNFAMTEAQNALKMGISSPLIYWHLARASVEAGAPEKEVAVIAKRVLGEYADDPMAWDVAGQIFELVEDEDGAELTYRQAVDEDRDPAGRTSLLLGRLLARTPSRTDEAEAYLRAAIDKGQDDWCGPLKELAEVLIHLGDDVHAEDLVSRALDIDSRCYCSLLLKGDIAIRQKDLAAARAYLEKALEAEPSGIVAMTVLAKISQPAEAATLIEKAHDLAPEHPLVLLARSRLSHRSLQERIADVERALEIDPRLAEAKLELAVLIAGKDNGKRLAALLADALSAVKNRLEIIPLFVESAVQIVRQGLAPIVEEVLNDPHGTPMEPLLIALRMYRGDDPVVAKEVRDVAMDILDQMLRDQPDGGYELSLESP